MNYTALRALIDGEPANAARTDAEVLAWLDELITVRRPIGSRVLLRWGAAAGRLARLEDAAATHAAVEVRAIARAAVLTVSRPDTELDLADGTHVALVDALVNAGVLTADDRTGLVTLAERQERRSQGSGLGRATTEDVRNARVPA